jgi:hypothetical protein
MSKLSQSQKIVELLKASPNQRFNARQIAEQIIFKYPEDYRDKRANPRFRDEKAFILQVVAEIGAQKDQIIKNDAKICWQDKPRPRTYWYDSEKVLAQYPEQIIDNDKNEDEEDEEEEDFPLSTTINVIAEYDLYPILINYLKS